MVSWFILQFAVLLDIRWLGSVWLLLGHLMALHSNTSPHTHTYTHTTKLSVSHQFSSPLTDIQGWITLDSPDRGQPRTQIMNYSTELLWLTWKSWSLGVPCAVGLVNELPMSDLLPVNQQFSSLPFKVYLVYLLYLLNNFCDVGGITLWFTVKYWHLAREFCNP